MSRHIIKLLHLLPAALVSTLVYADVDIRPIGSAVERHVSTDTPRSSWVHSQALLDADSSDQLALVETAVDDANIVKLKGLVPAIYFQSGVADIPASTLVELQTVMANLADRSNVRLHLVGHADNQDLSPRLATLYADNAGLSRERAGQVADFFQSSLALSAESITYEWAGDSKPVASNATSSGRARNRRVEVEVWYDKREDAVALSEMVVPSNVRTVKVCRTDTVCKLSYAEGHDKRARVQNLIAPLYYDASGIDVSNGFIERVRRTLGSLSDRHNVVVKMVGHTDSTSLSERDERIYGDHAGLSKARAWRVALAVQEALNLPTGAIDATGHGHTQPVATDTTPLGRGLNRRVAVEFWYDDPLQALPDEPQLCPLEGDGQLVTRVHQSTEGELPRITVDQGALAVPAMLASRIGQALAEVSEKTNPRVRFVGYTANATLDRRTAKVYEDDVGLATARARRAMQTVQQNMGLAPSQVEAEGRGFVQADDVVNAGFTQGDRSFVAVQVVYDEIARDDRLDGLSIQPMSRELQPESAFALNLMRITVDGKPVDDTDRSSSDVQRCTDVALENADIQFAFNNLSVQRRLSVDALPEQSKVTAAGELAEPVQFQVHSNYLSFITRSEVRILPADASPRATPIAVLPVDDAGYATWQPERDTLKIDTQQLMFVARVYDADDAFDETRPQTLWLSPANSRADNTPPAADAEKTEKPGALLAGYGENELAVQNVRLGSGTVRVSGMDIPADHSVWVAGHKVPVDSRGGFVSEQILPEGAHTVEVAVLDDQGNGELYLRDLEFERRDWFYTGMADFTFAQSDSSGAAELLQGDEINADVQGRLAFYADGKFGNQWHLTTSLDTREGPLDEMFSDFVDKTPESLLRRIDPDYHYPTFGDDSTVIEQAPTSGKFYLRAGRDGSHALWGNYNVGYDQNELVRVDRGLYGLNLHHVSTTTTSFGEPRFAIDGFGAEPGTVPARQEFRGTGGSLYFLRHQDLLMGSERIQIEMRDPVSGLVTHVVNLRPSQDYDLDYLQGTVMLAEPLSSIAQSQQLVRDGAMSGEEAYLVVRYEYTPGFDELDAVATGAQAHYWVGEHVKIGVTGSHGEADGDNNTLTGGQLVLRQSSNSWIKFQTGEAEGVAVNTLQSQDGGFEFQSATAGLANERASAYRVDVNVGLEDYLKNADGRISLYHQITDAGYLSPGLVSPRDTTFQGGTFALPVNGTFTISGKSDHMEQDLGLSYARHEVNVEAKLNDQWRLGTGLRLDDRNDASAVVPLTQSQGDRIDAVVQIAYDSLEQWQIYGFVQDTVDKSETRESNARAGIGGSYQWRDTIIVDGELSGGDGGTGGKLGTRYAVSNRTSLYLNYALENERTDTALRTRSGRQGNLVAGAKTRLSDSTSVYAEERYSHGTYMTGYTHATGVNYTPAPAWNMGLSTDLGTFRNLQTGAETERNAAGLRLSYSLGRVFLSSAAEYRQDQNEQADLSAEERSTWLFRSSLKFQQNASVRLIGQVGHSASDSSLGQFYDGGFTEVSLGYAIRPVRHDRINALMKYTYFYNVPTAGQVTLRNSRAEYIQRSHVAALDVDYDLTPRWSIGGKYAYRSGEISIDRTDLQWFDNEAHLFIARTDYQFLDNWSAMLEGRQLTMPSFGETRTGGLVTVMRKFGDHVRLGVGYNFTDFSDDLTDLNFDHRGAFLNLTGSI